MDKLTEQQIRDLRDLGFETFANGLLWRGSDGVPKAWVWQPGAFSKNDSQWAADLGTTAHAIPSKLLRFDDPIAAAVWILAEAS